MGGYAETIAMRWQQYQELGRMPLRVTATMRTPICATLPGISLDSAIAFAVVRDIAGPDSCDMMGCGASDLIDIPLPLEKQAADSKEWFWSASFGIYDAPESITRYRKRWDEHYDDVVEFGPKRLPRIIHKAYHFKALDQPMVIRSADTVVWYLVGDQDETARLLSDYVPHIGKKGAHGYGRVARWAVEPIEEDLSCWIGGWPARPIPCSTTNADPLLRSEHYGFRPPYWAPQNQALCYVP